MLRAVSIPDVLPSDLPTGANFSLVAGMFVHPYHTTGLLIFFVIIGDFEEIYGIQDEEEGAEEEGAEEEPHAGEWDAIMTCFFIDTVRSSPSHYHAISPNRTTRAGEEHSKLPPRHPSHPRARWSVDQPRTAAVAFRE